MHWDAESALWSYWPSWYSTTKYLLPSKFKFSSYISSVFFSLKTVYFISSSSSLVIPSISYLFISLTLSMLLIDNRFLKSLSNSWASLLKSFFQRKWWIFYSFSPSPSNITNINIKFIFIVRLYFYVITLLWKNKPFFENLKFLNNKDI